MLPFAGEIGVANPDLFRTNGLPLHFLFFHLFRSKFQRKFIAVDGRVSRAHASENPIDPSRISASRASSKYSSVRMAETTSVSRTYALI